MSIGRNQPYSFMYSCDVGLIRVSWLDDYVTNSSNMVLKLWTLD